MGFFRSLWEDFKAWRRGEQRVAPRSQSGRVYARNDRVEAPGGAHNVSARATAVCRAKITRADGTVEHVTLPAEVIELD